MHSSAMTSGPGQNKPCGCHLVLSGYWLWKKPMAMQKACPSQAPRLPCWTCQGQLIPAFQPSLPRGQMCEWRSWDAHPQAQLSYSWADLPSWGSSIAEPRDWLHPMCPVKFLDHRSFEHNKMGLCFTPLTLGRFCYTAAGNWKHPIFCGAQWTWQGSWVKTMSFSIHLPLCKRRRCAHKYWTTRSHLAFKHSFSIPECSGFYKRMRIKYVYTWWENNFLRWRQDLFTYEFL